MAVDTFQAISGAAFSTFSVLHLATHFSAIIGKQTHEKVFKSSRAYYQNKVIEVGLGIALIVHGSSAIYKYYKKYQLKRKLKNKNNDTTGSSAMSTDWISPRQLNKYFGITLLLIMPLHIIGARIMTLKLIGYEASSKLDGSHIYMLVQTSIPALLRILYPIGLYHTIYGLNICYQRLFETKPWINPHSKVLSYGIIVVGSVISQLIFKGYGGTLYDVNISKEQSELFEPVIEVLKGN